MAEFNLSEEDHASLIKEEQQKTIRISIVKLKESMIKNYITHDNQYLHPDQKREYESTYTQQPQKNRRSTNCYNQMKSKK